MSYSDMTQMYSTFGDKLLQHTDVLYSIQNDKIFKPITVQLCPTERCDLNCSYCSVKNRDRSSEMSLDVIIKGLEDFRCMGAKSLEITGGGNPLLYPFINEVISSANSLGYDIGIITNSSNPRNYLTESSINSIKWIRISLSGLDVDKAYFLNSIPSKKLGLSYIINDKTTENIIKLISQMATFYDVKFVRLAPDCLGDAALSIFSKWNSIIEKYNNDGKMFIKEIEDNYYPFECGCYVGLVRPYWNSTGVYICSSHVLKTQNYEPDWKLCDIENIQDMYKLANNRFSLGLSPYEIDIKKCYHCYYYNNNRILHTVSNEMPDRNFA